MSTDPKPWQFQKGNQLSKNGEHEERSGRKPKLTEEEREKTHRAWGETVVGSAVRIRDLILNQKWDGQKLSPTHKYRLDVAWKVLDKYFPRENPDLPFELKQMDGVELQAQMLAMIYAIKDRVARTGKTIDMSDEEVDRVSKLKIIKTQ